MRLGVRVELALDLGELAASFWAAASCAAAAAALWRAVRRAVLRAGSRLAVATGAIACISTLAGTWLALAVEPCWAIALPPGRMLPENAAFSDCCRVWYLEMLTEEIENRTMNSAISSVIMSA